MKTTLSNPTDEQQTETSRVKTALLFTAAAIGGLIFAMIFDFIDGGIHFTLQ